MELEHQGQQIKIALQGGITKQTVFSNTSLAYGQIPLTNQTQDFKHLCQ